MRGSGKWSIGKGLEGPACFDLARSPLHMTAPEGFVITIVLRLSSVANRFFIHAFSFLSVSYTHLTLPTIYSV